MPLFNTQTMIPQIMSNGNTPTITVQSAAGSGASASIVGNNVAGKITLTTGLSLLNTGKVLALTFADGMTFPNGCFITFTPADVNFSGVYTKLYAQTSTTGVDLFVGVTALSVSTTYIGYYHIIGY